MYICASASINPLWHIHPPPTSPYWLSILPHVKNEPRGRIYIWRLCSHIDRLYHGTMCQPPHFLHNDVRLYFGNTFLNSFMAFWFFALKLSDEGFKSWYIPNTNDFVHFDSSSWCLSRVLETNFPDLIHSYKTRNVCVCECLLLHVAFNNPKSHLMSMI